MLKNKLEKPPLVKMPSITRTRVDMENPSLVSLETFAPGKPLPLVIQPAVNGLDPIAWAGNNAAFVESKLLEAGAILFRGFDIEDVDRLNMFITALSGPPMEYCERSSPRSNVGDRIYTSTDYPADQVIFPHNEHSYSKIFPLKLFFFCKTPASEGGETPLADCRKIFRSLSPRIRDRFTEKKWMYVRNFGDGFGLSWQEAFQTEDRKAVETYCRTADVQAEWKERDRLRTRQVRPAVITHPRTGEPSWFNHATFFHISTLPGPVQSNLRAEFPELDLPNNTYYGDGSSIESGVLDELRAAYLEQAVSFAWERRDLILLDNIATAHARNRYAGSRRIFFAMSEPYSRNDF
jgi:alpha-ketoglutarate-dependent taurine dioxygenase